MLLFGGLDLRPLGAQLHLPQLARGHGVGAALRGERHVRGGALVPGALPQEILRGSLFLHPSYLFFNPSFFVNPLKEKGSPILRVDDPVKAGEKPEKRLRRSACSILEAWFWVDHFTGFCL